MGCANYHCWIVFEDGVKWLARFPRVTEFSDIPASLIEHLVESEYATLRFLEQLDVPTPRAHGFELASDSRNEIGVSYTLEDAMPGQPFNPHRVTAEQKEHVLSQYTDMLIQIAQNPLQQACSPLPIEDGITQGPIASDRNISLARHGPYDTSLKYANSIANFQLDLIADGQFHPEFPKEAFLFYHLLASRAAPAMTSDLDGFFLKHVDDKGDHILVDEEFNITGVIDWQFARFVPACEAFGPSLFTANLNNLYSGTEGLSGDDLLLAKMLRQKGRGDLAGVAQGGELARRFHLGLPSGLMKEEVLPMIRAILSLLDGKRVSDEDTAEWMDREWQRLAKDARQQKVNQLLCELEEEEAGS